MLPLRELPPGPVLKTTSREPGWLGVPAAGPAARLGLCRALHRAFLSVMPSPGPRALPCEAPGWPLARGGASTQPPAAVAGRGAGSLAAQPQSLQARSLWLLSRANKGAHVRAVCSLATVISYQLQRLLVLSPFFQLCPGRRSSESKGTCARHSFSFKRSQTLGGKKDQIFLFLKEGNVLTYQETITS